MVENKDIVSERKTCTFNVEEFASWYHEGKKNLEEKRFYDNYFLNDPSWQDSTHPNSYLSHTEQYEEGIRKGTATVKMFRKLQKDGKVGGDMEEYLKVLGGMLGSCMVQQGSPLGVHFTMFLPALKNLATPEQKAEWWQKSVDCKIIGTYAQTELGHGTFVRGLETTATYDERTEEFILNSPTLTSYKWWPGGLGHTANYAIVVAQLYIKKKHHGIQLFIVPLRSEKTHMPLPGIKIGEIGKKFGFGGVNNGFLGMENIRIPRKNMLMKNVQVLADGTFVKSPNAKLNYGTMMFVRVVIIKDMSNNLAKAVTIATRYSTVRRQSPINPNDAEVKVLDHVTQQMKLFPVISKAIVFKLTADYLWEMYNQVNTELSHGKLERLPELHALSCCLKSVCTGESAQAVEICRRATGGHGYMQSSGFPDIYVTVTAAETYEGENTVMLLQTARYLLKVWNQISEGETKVPPTVAYLVLAFKNRNQRIKWNGSVTGIVQAFQTVTAGKIDKASKHLHQRIMSGKSLEIAANETSIELASCSDAHCKLFILSCGLEMLQKAALTLSNELGTVFKLLGELYALDLCLKSLGDLLQFVDITSEDIEALQARLETVLALLRPNAVGIVDGFDIPDKVLTSVLGCYDGNIYERIFEAAMKSPLNQEPVNKSFELYLKPFMQSKL